MSGSKAARWLFRSCAVGCVGLFMADNGFAVMNVRGASMYPALNAHLHGSAARELVVVDKRIPYNKMERGMIVAFWSPNDPEQRIVKRIVAVEGDEVVPGPPYPATRTAVPYGHVWVEGDNLDVRKTLDSRMYGPIPKGLVIGRVTAALWPRMRWLAPGPHPSQSQVIRDKYPVDVPEFY